MIRRQGPRYRVEDRSKFADLTADEIRWVLSGASRLIMDARMTVVNVAKAKRATPAIQALLRDASGVEIHYLIEVGMDAWEQHTPKQKRAIIDHELHHFAGQNEKGRWRLVGHDIQEFTNIVRRYGAYHADLETFVGEVRQLKLPLE